MSRFAVLYARVSSKDQEREGFSIPAQLDLLRSYAAGRNLSIIQDFVDVETAKQAGRAAFGQMVAFARKHRGRLIVLVEKTDRLYRNLRDWVTIDELDVEIHLVKENVVLSPESRSHWGRNGQFHVEVDQGCNNVDLGESWFSSVRSRKRPALLVNDCVSRSDSMCIRAFTEKTSGR